MISETPPQELLGDDRATVYSSKFCSKELRTFVNELARYNY